MLIPSLPLRGQLALTASILALTSLSQPAFAQDQAPEATQCPDGKTAPVGQPCPATSAGSTDAQPGSTADSTLNGNAPDDAIVVTGSRIARKELQSVSPVTVLDSKSIETRGFSTIGQALNELPSFGVPGASPVGAGQSSFGPGQSFVDFLGLGSQRTLTLVNGRRFVGSNTSSIFGPTGSGGNQVDLNVIPTKLVDRIETVAAIGAPIYGSDAIAGTINVLLKRDYQGVDLDVQYGISSRGDARDYRVRGLAGKNFAEGRGNITVSGEYNKSSGLLYTDRDLTSTGDFFARPNTASQFRNVITRDRRIPSISDNGIPLVGGANVGLDISLSPVQTGLFVFGDPTETGYTFGVGPVGTNGQTRFDQQGNLIPLDFGTPTGLPTAFSTDFSGGNGYSLVPVSNLLTDSKRYNANVLANFEVTDKLHVFAEGWYSVSEGTNAVAQPVYNSGLFDAAGTRDGNLIIPLSNPFLSAAARSAIQASIINNPLSDQNNPFGDPALDGITQNYFYLGRANVDLASGLSRGKVEVMRGVFGLDGTVNVLPGRDWKFEASANYGRSRTTGEVPELNEQNFRNALNSTIVNGQIVCAPGFVNSPIATVSSTCAAFNPFGQQNSQAVKDYVTTIATPKSVNEQIDFIASLAGPLFSLPGGDLSFALGYEHRVEKQRFDPGAFYFGGPDNDPTLDDNGDGNFTNDRTSFGRSVPIDPVRGKFHTNEIFGELNADLISADQHIPLIRSFSVQTAGRYVMNSIAGNDFTYTAGARWQPIRDITFRGAYTRAIRSPAITEAFNPSSSAFIFATDPCDAANRDSGPAPATRAANCTAAGLPANFNSLSSQRSFPGVVVGNANLGNEKSDSYTIGAVIQPRFLRNFSVTADYVDITLNNVISQFGADDVLNACYDSADFPNNPFCGNVTRDTTTGANRGQLTNVITSYFNSDQLRYKGILVGADYRVATPFLGELSRVSFNVSYQYLDTLTSRAGANDASTVTDGSIGYSTNKGIGSVGYENGGFAGQVQVAYIGPAKYSRNVADNFYEVDGVGSVAFVNLSASYNVGKNFTLRGTVDNVLNTKPPYPSPIGGGVTTYFRGILGTYFRIGAAVHF